MRTISVFTSNKKRFGQLVNIFCAHITAYELVPILVDLLHFEVVSDLEGTVDSLLSQISYLDEDTRNQVRSRFKINEKGNIVASDEDDNGNLK